MKDRSLKEAAFYGFLIIIMVVSLCFAVKDLSGLDISYMKLTLYTIPIIFVTLSAVYFPVILLALLIFGAGYTAYLAIYKSVLLQAFFTKAYDFFYWLQGYIVGYENFKLQYSLAFSILFIVFCTLIIALLTVSKKGSFILIIAGSAAHAFFWFRYVSKARELLLLFLFASILLYTYKIYKKKSGEWLKLGGVTAADVGKRWIANSCFIIIFSLVVTYMLPLSIKPFRWEWLNDKVVNFFPFVLDWRNDVMDSYSYGFNSRYISGVQGGKANRLGGPVLLDNSIMLSINTENTDTLYLRGIVKDYYTGKSWIKSNKSSFEYKSNDTLALPYDVNEVKTYNNAISITPKKLLTSTIFAPYKLYVVRHKDNRFYVDEDSEAYFSKLVTRKETYAIEYVSPYIDENELRKINVKGDFNTSYVQLPDSLSERVIELSREITSKHDNDYDRIKAVEQYLRTNYTYTLEPSVVPANGEFVEHFLFEEKQGYCTYFATALAILLRASDIPCRYVEGFMSAYDGSTSREIRGTAAHAWIEVNFGKFGWITFEATPAYSQVSFREYQGVTHTDNIQTNDDEHIKNPLSDYEDANKDNNRMVDEDEFGTSSDKNRTGTNFGFYLILKYIFAVLILLRLSAYVLVKLIREVLIKKASGRIYAQRYLKSLLFYFRKMNFHMDKDETLREFFDTVKLRLMQDDDTINKVCDLLEKAMYSNSIISIRDRKLMERYRKTIKKYIVHSQGAFKFYWRELIFGI